MIQRKQDITLKKFSEKSTFKCQQLTWIKNSKQTWNFQQIISHHLQNIAVIKPQNASKKSLSWSEGFAEHNSKE